MLVFIYTMNRWTSLIQTYISCKLYIKGKGLKEISVQKVWSIKFAFCNLKFDIELMIPSYSSSRRSLSCWLNKYSGLTTVAGAGLLAKAATRVCIATELDCTLFIVSHAWTIVMLNDYMLNIISCKNSYILTKVWWNKLLLLYSKLVKSNKKDVHQICWSNLDQYKVVKYETYSRSYIVEP